MIRCFYLAIALMVTVSSLRADDKQSDSTDKQKNAKLEKVELVDTRNVHVLGNVMTAGQPSEQALQTLADRGFKVVVSLRRESEESFDEAKVCKRLGMTFIRLPIGGPEDMTPKLFQEASRRLSESKADAKVLLHCASANRVGAVWMAHRVTSDKLPIEDAQQEANQVGLRSEALREAALKYLKNVSSKSIER